MSTAPTSLLTNGIQAVSLISDYSLFLGLDVETVLHRNDEIARQGVGVGDSAARGSDGVVDVRQFVEQVETIGHERPASPFRRVGQTHVPDGVGRVEFVDAVAYALVEVEVGADAEACGQGENTADAIFVVLGVDGVEVRSLRRCVAM